MEARNTINSIAQPFMAGYRITKTQRVFPKEMPSANALKIPEITG